jgi:hypothetical protein
MKESNFPVEIQTHSGEEQVKQNISIQHGEQKI